jgi:integrase
MKTTKVTIWAIRRNNSSKKPSWVIRWKTADKAHSQTRSTKALAESFRSELLQAVKRGEEFDIYETGLPDSMVEKESEAEPVRSVLTVAQEYVVKRWPHDPPNTRDGISDALSTVMPALVGKEHADAPKPKELRTALRSYILLPPDKRPEPTPLFTRIMTWLESASLPITDLDDAKVARDALDMLALTLNGKAAKPNTVKRKRAAFHTFLEYVVEINELRANPLHKVKWKPPKSSDLVDPRVVVNQKQARALLEAAATVGDSGQGRSRGKRLWPMFACMYYAAMRPGEVIGLRESDCYLPAKDWGRITLAKSRPETNRKWTDTNDAHEERGLKHRAEAEVRPIPIPPVLVAILREYLKTYGTGDDSHIFRSERGKPVASTAYTEVWKQARVLALTPEQIASPLAARPYDLRHAAVSLWLNGGVSPTEIAKRAGHSVKTLLSVYANCVVGQDKIANRRIEKILAQDPDEDGEDAPGVGAEDDEAAS